MGYLILRNQWLTGKFYKKGTYLPDYEPAMGLRIKQEKIAQADIAPTDIIPVEPDETFAVSSSSEKPAETLDTEKSAPQETSVSEATIEPKKLSMSLKLK